MNFCHDIFYDKHVLIMTISKLELTSITSVWETVSSVELEQKLIDIENEIEALRTSQNTIENVLFYRKHPECTMSPNTHHS